MPLKDQQTHSRQPEQRLLEGSEGPLGAVRLLERPSWLIAPPAMTAPLPHASCLGSAARLQDQDRSTDKFCRQTALHVHQVSLLADSKLSLGLDIPDAPLSLTDCAASHVIGPLDPEPLRT
jgi:hypothetical protein